jgi:DNA-binding NtrC family response regulator
VVDDEPDTRMFYEEVLIDAGFDVHCESDGMRALQYASVHRVDLVVTDARMPTLDGLSMLPFFENAQVRVPVIVVSAYPEYNSDVLKKYSAVKAFFQKPLDADQLILKIRQCLFMV